MTLKVGAKEETDERKMRLALEKECLIGRGAFAACYLAVDRSSGRRFALKELTDHSEGQGDAASSAVEEIKLLAELNHPHVIQYITSFASEGVQSIVMEFAAGGSLEQSIQAAKEASQKFAPEQVVEWFAQILLAISYIHSQGILHRDIKPGNLLLWVSLIRVERFSVRGECVFM